MRRIIYIVFLLTAAIGMSAQGHGFQIGLRGGAAMALDKGSSVVPLGALNVDYRCMFHLRSTTDLGFSLGLEMAYQQQKNSQSVQSTLEKTDYQGHLIQYTLSADISQTGHQFNLSMPILFALRTHGFTLHVGPRLALGNWTNYQQKANNGSVVAYFPEYGVPVYDDPATGAFTDRNKQIDISKSEFRFGVGIRAEVGYEWEIGRPYSRYNEQYIGLLLFADYNVWTMGKSATSDVLTIDAATATAAPAIHIAPLSNHDIYPLAIGIRFYYAFQTVDYPGHGWHRW